MSSFVAELNSGFSPDPEENVFSSIWNEYERVIMKSLITSFGLDFLVHDQHGGDVDTIHNVREIGKDPNMKYKSAQNQADYENRGAYDKAAYHSDSRYRQIVKEAKKNFDENGTMVDDAYVPGNKVVPRRNNTIPREKQAQLDHVLAAEDIHNDPGRILAELDGLDLANSECNLRFTNACLNLNMSNMTIDEYLNWCKENPDKVNWNGKKGEPIPPEVEERLRKEYARAKKDYDAKLAKAYYTSPKFLKDTAAAAGSRGAEMGMRQAMGFVFVEIWMSSKEESPDYAVYYSTGRANMKFLELLFKTPQYIGEFKKKSSGVGEGLTRLYTKDLFSIYCAIPKENEQNDIVKYVVEKITEIDKLIQEKDLIVQEMEKYKKSLIYEVITGKRKVV